MPLDNPTGKEKTSNATEFPQDKFRVSGQNGYVK